MNDLLPFVALAAIAALIAWPAFDAWRRRVLSREASAIAVELQAYASAVRAAQGCLPLDATLRMRVTALRRDVPEIVGFLLTQDLSRLSADALADAAQRLSLRLRRRVAFERKMLARTASGLKRGAVAAAIPPVLLLVFAAAGVVLPASGLLALLTLEALGCWLLWRLARVDI
jgi:hypothetical protein